MRAREYANWENPKFAPLMEPVRRVMEAYGNAEKWFADIPHDYHLRLPYPGTPELDEDFNDDLDRVFEVCVAIVDGVNEALGGFIRATADGEFNALSLKAEELQLQNTGDRQKLLSAWSMWDTGSMSRASFDNWCRNLFAEDGEDA